MEALPQRRADDSLEDEVEAHVLVLAHVVQRHHGRVRERGRRARLLPHAIDELRLQLGRQPEVIAQDLERHLASQHRVAREEHPPHAALAEQVLDVVAADAGGQVHA